MCTVCFCSRLLLINRPIRLTQCCTQFRSLGVKVLCVFHLYDNIAFTFKWYGNTWNKTFYSQRIWIGYNIELAEAVYFISNTNLSSHSAAIRLPGSIHCVWPGHCLMKLFNWFTNLRAFVNISRTDVTSIPRRQIVWLPFSPVATLLCDDETLLLLNWLWDVHSLSRSITLVFTSFTVV